MVFPTITPGMEEWNQSAGARVTAVGSGLFVAVAPETAKGKVRKFARTTPRFGNDVIEGEIVTGKRHQRVAVLARVPRPLLDARATSGLYALQTFGAPQHYRFALLQ